MLVKNKVIIVTGGGGGIGREIVLYLLNKGASVAALDINEIALEKTVSLAGQHKSRLSTHIINVTNQVAVEAIPKQILDRHGSIDGLINNSGIIHDFKKLNDLDYKSIKRVIDINLYGVVYMTKTFLPYLLDRPKAHIVNISSMGGFFPVPGQTLYGASKAAVKILTEGLYAELLETNVHVSVVFPGVIETNVVANSGVKDPMAGKETKGSPPTTKPDVAAKTIIDGMEKDKFQIMVGKDAKMMNVFYRILPKRATKFMYNQMKFMLEN